MSNEIRCNLSNEDLIIKAKEWIDKLLKSGGKDWSLRVPVNLNHDPDVIFIELCNRLQSPDPSVLTLQEEVERLKGLIEKMWNKDINTFYDGMFDNETKEYWWNHFKTENKL